MLRTLRNANVHTMMACLGGLGLIASSVAETIEEGRPMTWPPGESLAGHTAWTWKWKKKYTTPMAAKSDRPTELEST